MSEGGAERLLLKEYKYFKKLGYNVKLVSYKIESTVLCLENVDENDVVCIGDSPLSMFSLYKYFLSQKKAHILCASGDIDIYLSTLLNRHVSYSLHIHQPSFMTYSVDAKYSVFMGKYFDQFLPMNFGAEKLNKIRDNLTLLQRFAVNLKSFFSIRAVKCAENVFVLSKYAKYEKKILYGVNSHVCYGAIEEDVLNYCPQKKLNIPESKNKHIILSICRLDKNKRVDVLIEAIGQYVKQYTSEILLYIGGKGPELKNLQMLVSKLELENNVVLLGFIDESELYEYYSAADLFVTIDWADYRITSFESLAMGTKVLMATESEYDKELRDGGYVYITKATSEDVCCEINKSLIETPTISRDDLNVILKKYTWGRYCNNIVSILEKNHG